MQFQVPQFIGAEDKIVGPFSLRQFLYVGASGALSFAIFYTVQTWLAVMLSMIFVSLGLALAFVKVNGRPLTSLVVAAFHFYWSPQRYAWKAQNAPRAPSAPLATETHSAREEALTGSALQRVWEKLQAGGGPGKSKLTELSGRYEIFRRQTGERRVARRVDYR